jgi:GAF domain-containing protein
MPLAPPRFKGPLHRHSAICFHLDMPLSNETLTQWKGLRTGYWPTDLSNASALVFEAMPDLNWAGFYLMQENGELKLGPFQGKVACVSIPKGKGVCGKAALDLKPLLVPDVDAFPGHIACDARSRSELVVPLVKSGKCWGVLDLDSPTKSRFTPQESGLLAAFCVLLLEPWQTQPWP